jgi:hypothetical protein
MAISQARIIESMEQVCSNLNPDEFIFSFLDAYGFPKSTITRLRKGGDSRNIAKGNDIGLKKKLYFRAVAENVDLDADAESLKTSEVVARNDIRFVIVTDFKRLVAFDLKAEERLETTLDELDKQYAFFLPLAGFEKAVMYSEHPADVKASEKMGQLFDLIRERNELSKPDDIHALNVFLTRLLFCFYAEDTDIFEPGQMTSAIQSCTQDDGSDVDQFFTDIFVVLNLRPNAPERKSMPSHFQAFPYVNGGLFLKDVPAPKFGRKARRILIDCGSLDWSEINPDIFGSMFQAVIDEEQRGNLGQHYTSVLNIMKVIQPLFLDKLYAELDKSRKSARKLKELLVRLQSVRVFDPACGSGNFLIIAYKELRKLEMEVIDALNAASGQAEMYYSGIRLSQFYGIEIDDFAHEVAILSLWLAEHQMNMAFKVKFGYAEPSLPLRDAGNIVCDNSLRLDWEALCPPVDTSGNPYEVYICGNPPYKGFNKQAKSHKNDIGFVFENEKQFGKLDYVCCWFYLAAKYIHESTNHTESAFVSTSSVCEGEQPALLFPIIFRNNIEIGFAYSSFFWKNNAKDNASTRCVIISLREKSSYNKYLFSGKSIKKSQNINPYLLDGDNVFLTGLSSPISERPVMTLGSNSIDGMNLIITEAERSDFIDKNPEGSKFIKKFAGGSDILKGKVRYCIWVTDYDYEEAKNYDFLKSKFDSCKSYRLGAGRDAKKMANQPFRFCYITHQEKDALVIPQTSTGNRAYIPISISNPDTVISAKAFAIYKLDMFIFGLLSSKMHYEWMDITSGKPAGGGFAYSVRQTYNTFPLPSVSEDQRGIIEYYSENILLTREDYPDKSLADLYDPGNMPAALLDAHKELDRQVEKLYREKPFRDATERLEHLFARYEKLIAEEKANAPTKKTARGSK